MLKKFLREVVVIIVGKQAEEIAGLLNSKKHVNEFIIAKKMDITINQTRNILYKISDYGLVSSIRKKDKKKGWYTYFWKTEVLKSLEFLKNILLKKIAQIDFQIKSRETKEFYICERCNIELNEENALLQDFTCNECGAIFTIKDNSKLLRDFKRSKGKLEKELELVEEEIVKEEMKVEKGKEKIRKNEEKEKAMKRAEAAAKRKIARELTMKKLGKKKVVKKKVKKKAKKKKKVKKKVAKKKPLKKKAKKPLRGRSPTRSLRIKRKVVKGKIKKITKKIKKPVSKIKKRLIKKKKPIKKKKVVKKKAVKKKAKKKVKKTRRRK
ncbi:hypothetical protein GOV13_03265 [Candidatus Pacearchaeota archaeon]|nr:hypothetical protein [Candidatus Pacearchaeota archaeon]